MSSTLVQLRVDAESKLKATDICRQLGFDLPEYLRICIIRLIRENGVPFPMTLREDRIQKAFDAIRRANRIAEENGISEMSLEEINEEIAATRRERRI